MSRDWLGRTSPKMTILCQVGCKTLTQSISSTVTKQIPKYSKNYSRTPITNYEKPLVLAKRHTTVSLSFLKFTGLQLMVAQGSQGISEECWKNICWMPFLILNQHLKSLNMLRLCNSQYSLTGGVCKHGMPWCNIWC